MNNDGLKKDSIANAIALKFYPSDPHKAAKVILKRVQTNKFKKFWDELQPPNRSSDLIVNNSLSVDLLPECVEMN